MNTSVISQFSKLSTSVLKRFVWRSKDIRDNPPVEEAVAVCVQVLIRRLSHEQFLSFAGRVLVCMERTVEAMDDES